jgi:hypothetical protein
VDDNYIDTEGKYQTNIAGTQVTYILYDSNKTVIRAGTESVEYSSDYLVGRVQALSFDLLVNTVSTSSTFSLVPDDSLPSWVSNNSIIQFVEGWWRVVDNTWLENLPVYTYILYDSDKTVLRAGSESYEYNPVYVEDNSRNYYDFDLYAQCAPNCPTMLFTPVPDSELPEWTDKEDGTLQFTEGWWRHQYINSDYSTTAWYILYDSDKTVLRAGSESYESTNLEDTLFAWYYIANTVSSIELLTPVSDDLLPDWAVEELTSDTTGLWWIFENGWYDNGVYYDLFAYYEGSTFIKGGTWAYQIPNSQLLFSKISKEDATSSWIGGDYQLTDLSQLPSWAYL